MEGNDEKLVHIILVGQPELKKTLKLKCMRQLRQRISVFHDLKPLNYNDMKNYIIHRITHAKRDDVKTSSLRTMPMPQFSFFALRKIYSASKGIPRMINNICDKALISAFIDYSQKIRLKDVRRALKEMKKIKSI
jgi:general secretion pathway protein A